MNIKRLLMKIRMGLSSFRTMLSFISYDDDEFDKLLKKGVKIEYMRFNLKKPINFDKYDKEIDISYCVIDMWGKDQSIYLGNKIIGRFEFNLITGHE
jgi:hypothetical protein